MGLFNKLFNGSNEPQSDDLSTFIDLERIEQLDSIIEKSKGKPQIIFKHSTRCGVSRMVLNLFRKEYPLSDIQADIYYLDLINYRVISNDIVNRFQIQHESPQLLIVKNGVVVAHESHGSINDIALNQYI